MTNNSTIRPWRKVVRFNNNLLNHGAFGRAVLAGATKRDLQILLSVLNEAQRRKTRYVHIKAVYHALQALGWSIGGRDHDLFWEALRFWRAHEMMADAWYDGDVDPDSYKPKKGAYVTKEYRAQLARKRKKSLQSKEPKTCKIWTIKPDPEGDGFTIIFTREFYSMNRHKQLYCTIRLDLVQMLRRPEHIVLALLEDSIKRLYLTWSVDTIADKIGIKDYSNLSRRRQRVVDARWAVEAARKQLESKNPTVHQEELEDDLGIEIG